MARIFDNLYTPVYDEDTMCRIKNDFSRLNDEYYLDHAGATLYSDTQIKKITNDMLASLYANPHSAGVAGNLTKEIIERTRYRLLDYFHASTDEYSLIFTSGATGGLKIIAETFEFHDGDKKMGNFVHMQDNHTSVLGMRDVVAKNGAKIICLNHEKSLEVFAENRRKNIVATENKSGNSLFVYSAQCNFSGAKYPLEWTREVQNGTLDKLIDCQSNWYVLLDAASFAGTNELNLSSIKPDFVCLSFYKIFGYPTGIGALLVRKTSSKILRKSYYGGGTVNLAMSLENFHIKRDTLHERFEDGTLNFHSIISLQHGLDALSRIPMKMISKHVFSLAKYFYNSLIAMKHKNGKKIGKIYSNTNYDDESKQGGIVSFNLLRSNGDYIGYMEVVHMASLFKIHLRTGCFCNPGACQRFLKQTNRDVLNNWDAGYTCGGTRDLIAGKPTGAVRISFGYMSSYEDVEAVLNMIKKSFLDNHEKIDSVIKNDIDIITCDNSDETCRIDNNNTENNKNNEINTKSNEILSLARLFIYPIKSCAAFEITDEWILGDKGLQYDREWMIVTSAGICLSQKQSVNLCLIKPIICLKTNTLILNYPGMPAAVVRLDLKTNATAKGELCRSRVCGHRVEGIDCGPEISEWLSLALKRPNLRLIRQSDTKYSTKNTNKLELSFSSQAQYLLVNDASIRWISDKLPEESDCTRETIVYRFRGNMILQGSKSFQETNWSRVQIGKEVFEVDGPCTRCQMICIDQITGNKTVEPLRLLAEEFNGKMIFGVYLSRKNEKSSIIKIGDPIICV